MSHGLGKCRFVEMFRLLLEFDVDFTASGTDLLRSVLINHVGVVTSLRSIFDMHSKALDSCETTDFLLDHGVDINGATKDHGSVIAPHKTEFEPLGTPGPLRPFSTRVVQSIQARLRRDA